MEEQPAQVSGKPDAAHVHELIMGAMTKVTGAVTSKQLAEMSGLNQRTISSWMHKNAAANCIFMADSKPRLYRLDDPESRTRLQHILGYRPTLSKQKGRQIDARHTAADSRCYSLPRCQSAAFTTMESA